MGRAIGVDLGTTFSSAAVIEGGDPKIIPSEEGSRLVPSVVAIDKNGEWLVGELAKRQAILNPEDTVFSVKRLIGRKFTDTIVQADMRRLPYKVTEASNGDCSVVMGGKEYSPQEISAMILQKLKADAEAYLGETVTDAVITVPAYFNDSQRNATKDAGVIAGLNVMRIIGESTASALAYGMDKAQDQTIAVYDLGGGTFDISILDMGEGIFQVKSTNGDTHLGGDDFDQRITDWVWAYFGKEQGIILKPDKVALQRLKDAAEKAKRDLSSISQTEIDLPFITADASGPKHLRVTLTRSKLEELSMDLIERTLEPCRQALKDAGLTASQINNVILVGDQTRMPLVQNTLKKYFGREPCKGVDPDEAVARGAAIQAGLIKGEVGKILLLDVTPLTLGIMTLGGVATPLIPRCTTIPTSKSTIVSTEADSQMSIEIHVLQGERPMAADNRALGRFMFDGILPAPRGVPQIEVTFAIDPNGILSVSARDKGTGRDRRMTITASSGLTKEEVELMRQQAKRCAVQNVTRKVAAETRNNADSLTYTAEKTLHDHGDKMSDDVRQDIDMKTVAVKIALQGNDIKAIRDAMQELSQAMQKIVQLHSG